MYFDPSYFEGEERDGFYIRPMVKRAWAAQLEILKQVDIICKRHNITYFADWGTLLGAIRHKGFIPWDDDIDISMDRLNYTRFIALAKKELPEGYLIINVKENNNKTWVPRIANSSAITTNKAFLEQFHGCPYIMGIDIFVYDNIPLNKEEEELHLHLLKATSVLSQLWNDEEMSPTERQTYLHQVEELCNISFNQEESLEQQMFVLTDNICSLYWEEKAKEVTYFPSFLTMPHLRYPIELFSNFIEVPFENIMIPIPTAYHEILTIEYGDYMTPVQGTSSHNYPFFKTQEEILFEKYESLGMEIPEEFRE